MPVDLMIQGKESRVSYYFNISGECMILLDLYNRDGLAQIRLSADEALQLADAIKEVAGTPGNEIGGIDVPDDERYAKLSEQWRSFRGMGTDVERRRFIASELSELAEKLASGPGDSDSWERLAIRAQIEAVLRLLERTRAKMAAEHVRKMTGR